MVEELALKGEEAPHEEWVNSAAEFILRNARHVIETFGPRDPGSEGECKAQEFIRRELEQCADEVRTEPFQVAPKAFMGFLAVTGVLVLVSIVTYGFAPAVAFGSCAAAFTVAFLEIVRYRQALDPFFPKRTSYNVYAVRHAAGEPKRTLILGGHIDAAYEWRFNLVSRGALRGVALSGIVGMLFMTVLTAAHLFLGDFLQVHLGLVWRGVEFLRFACVPIGILALLYTRFSVVSPGANDNLSGTFAAIAVLKHLHESGIRFDHTEVACLITGSEEAGLRGAKAYVNAHKAELVKDKAALIALDTFRDTEHLAVYERDLNGTLRHHPNMCRLLKEAGKQCGLELRYESVYVGATDAVAFTQAGIPAATLAAMDPSPPRYYHTRLDNWTNMDAECLRRTVAVINKAVFLYDGEFGIQNGK